METHPDEQARIQQQQGIKTKANSPPFPYYEKTQTTSSLRQGIKPWVGPILKIKKLDPTATIPIRVNDRDAGFDLYALEDCDIGPHNQKLVKTGISMAIPRGYVGLIWPRSGLAHKYGLDVFAGVIDSGYRGDIGVILYNSKLEHYKIKKGERIAQILFQKIEYFDLIEVDDLDDSQRGAGGFGSSGK